MGGEVFVLRSPPRKRHSTSVTLAVFLSAVLFTIVVIFLDQCESQQLQPEHRGDQEGGIALGDYDDDDGGVVPIMGHRAGLQHEDVMTALPNHYYLPNQAQFPPSPVYAGNGTAPSTSATPSASTTSKDGKDFTPPSDIVRGFKPVYPDDARFVSITTSTVGPPPKRRKKVKRVKGQQGASQQHQQPTPQSPDHSQPGGVQSQRPPNFQQHQQQQQQQQGFQNSFGFQPTGSSGPFYHPHQHQYPYGQQGNNGHYFSAANHFYGFTAGNGLDSPGNGTHFSGHVQFPNDTSSGNSSNQVPPGYSTLYSTNPAMAGGGPPFPEHYQQQQGPYLSPGVPLNGAPGFPPNGPHGHPLGPPKMNPLKKLANFIRGGRPRPQHPGHPPMQGPHGPMHQGLPQGAQGNHFPMTAAANNQPQVAPPPHSQYPGPPQTGGPYIQAPPNGQQQPMQQRPPPYNPTMMQPQQQQQNQQQVQPQNQTNSGNGTAPTQQTAASNLAPNGYPNMGYPTGPGQMGPYGPPRPGGPQKNFLSKLNFNTYLKKFSNIFQRTGGPPMGHPPNGMVPMANPPHPGGKQVPQNGVLPHGPPPQQKVPQQMLYPHYYPMNTYSPNGPSPQMQGQLQQQQQQGNIPPNNQIRRRRIKVRKNMDPRNRKVDDAPEAQGDQKELIGRPRLAGQSDDTGNEDDVGEDEPKHVEDENAGGKRRRKRLATTASVVTSSSSSSSSTSGSEGHSSSGYRMPGIFGMDSGKAFYLDKDPQTGDITFNPPAGTASTENSAQTSGTQNHAPSNEVPPESKSKPIIIHSYSNTKTQGGLSTYKRPNLASLNSKFKAKRPTFYRFNKTSTLAPPRLPNFYSPSTTVFPTTTTTTSTTSAPVATSGEGAKTEFPNVIVAKSSSEIVTRVSSSSSSMSSSKEIVAPQYKKKSPVKFPLFKHTTPSTTTTTSSSTTSQKSTTTTTEEPPEIVTSTQTTPKPESTTTTTTTIRTTEEPTPSTLFFDPYLPFELLNLQKQALATTSTTTSTTTPSTTTSPTTTTTTTTTTQPPTTVDPYTVPDTVIKTSSSSSPVETTVTSEAPTVNGSSLIPTGPEEILETSQEENEDEDYYYDNPENGQGFMMPPGGANGQFNSFGQYRPGGPPPGGYFNPMLANGQQARPPMMPPHPNTFYNSFNPFGPPGYYPQPQPPQQPQNGQGGFYPEFQPSHGIPVSTDAGNTEITTASIPEVTSTTTVSSTTPSTTPTTTTEIITTTTEPSTTTTEATTQSTTESPSTTTSTSTIPPPPPPSSQSPQGGVLTTGEGEIPENYDDYEYEVETVATQQQSQPPQPPTNFHMPPPPPQRPQPPLPPHRRPPPPPPFMNRLPPMYFNNQRPPPARPNSGSFPFRPPPPVKDVMKAVTSGEVFSTSAATSTIPTTKSTTTPTTTTTTPPPPPTTTTPITTTTTPPPPPTTTTQEPTPHPHHHLEHHESQEAMNQDLFIPPEQLLAYTPSPDRLPDRIPDEVIQDIAPGFDLFNVQWGQKVPPPSSTSYSSQEQQPIPAQVQFLTTTSTTLAPPTTRIISRNVTEVNINGTDYIYEYIDEIIEEDAPGGGGVLNGSDPSPTPQQHGAVPETEGSLPPQQFYNPYLMNPYNGGFTVSSTPGGAPFGTYLLPNGQPAWGPPQQGPPYINNYYNVHPDQFPPHAIDGNQQQFVHVEPSSFPPSSVAPPQEPEVNPSAASPPQASPTPSVAIHTSHEILSASPSSAFPPLIPITENSVDNAGPLAPIQTLHTSAEVLSSPQPVADDLSESYIVSLIDPSKQNITNSLLNGLGGGFISSTSERLPLFQAGGDIDAVEHSNLISSTSGTVSPAPMDPQIHISSTSSFPSTTTTTDKAVSYEYIDYPDETPQAGNNDGSGGQAPDAQRQQIQNLAALQMMRPPPLPVPGQSPPGQGPPHGGPPPPHHQKKKPSSFLQNLFGKLRPGGPPGPPPHGHAPPPYPQQGLPGHGPGLNKNTFIGDNIPSGSGMHGMSASGVPLLPPVMNPSVMDPEKFNMDTLFGARNGSLAEDPITSIAPSSPAAPLSTQTTVTTSHQPSSAAASSTTGVTPTSAELGSEEEDEVIYVTPEELAKLKETGQVDDFELVEDEDEYDYEDEPLNDIDGKKVARSDTKTVQNETHISTSTLLKKTAPVPAALVAPSSQERSSSPVPSTTVKAASAPAPPSTPPPSPPAVEAQERKQDFYGMPMHQQYNQHSQQIMTSQQSPAIPSLGMFQMKPPPELGRPPHPQSQQNHHHSHPPPQPPHAQHHLNNLHAHQGRIQVPPPHHPPPFRGPPPPPQQPMSFQHQQLGGGSHYNKNGGQAGAPPSHFYNTLPATPSVTAGGGLPTPMEKRKDTFQPKLDYDESIELITAGPMLDPNVPRDIIVKSSFNTASGQVGPKPKSLDASRPPANGPTTASLTASGLWQGAVEKVSAFVGNTASYLQQPRISQQQTQQHRQVNYKEQQQNPQQDPFSSFTRSLPNHYDKSAHLRQQEQQPNHALPLSSRGMRYMYDHSTSSSSASNSNSNRQYWGPGI